MSDHDLRDLWRMVEVARSKAYAPPETAIDDYSGDCVCLRINTLWVPFLTGVIDLLSNPNLWVHDDADYAPQEIAKLILALMGSNPDMDCSSFITDIIFDDDGKIKFTRGGEQFEVAGTERLVTGVGFVDGGWEVEQGGEFDTISADCADPCNEYPDKPTYDKSGNGRSCAIATSLVEWFFEKYQDSIDIAEAAENMVTAMDLMLLLFPAAYLVVDAISDVVDEFAELGFSAARVLDTVEFREECTEALYCLLVDAGNVMTEELWTEFIDDKFPVTSLTLYPYARMLDYGGVDDRAHKSSYGDETGCETFNCTDCVTYVNFENAESSETYIIVEGEWESLLFAYGVANSLSDWVAKVVVRFNLAGMGEVGQVTYNMMAQRVSGGNGDRNHFQKVRVNSTGGGTVTVYDNVETLTEGTAYERTRTFTVGEYNWLEVELYAGFTTDQTGAKMILDDVCIQ